MKKFGEVFNSELMPKVASHNPNVRSGHQYKISILLKEPNNLKSKTILFGRKVTNYQKRKIYQNFISCTVKKKLEVY